MKRSASLIMLAFCASLPTAQPQAGERDSSRSGTISVEQLEQEPVSFTLEIPYGGTGNPRHRLDLYLPKEPASEKLPVIVFIHGGGWVEGAKSEEARTLLPFVRSSQYACASIGYRLSAEAHWPAQIHDCKAAVRWIRANASKYGLDPDRVGVWGRNAGGHLALMLGFTGSLPELEGDIGLFTEVSSRVQAVVTYSGPTELIPLIGQPSDIDRLQPNAPEVLLIGGSLLDNAERTASASPVTYVTKDVPPVMIVHGALDRIVPYDQAVRLDAALRKAGATGFLVTVTNGGHEDIGAAADAPVKAFFDKYLLGRDAAVSSGTLSKP